jgi:hypothetical protein
MATVFGDGAEMPQELVPGSYREDNEHVLLPPAIGPENLREDLFSLLLQEETVGTAVAGIGSPAEKPVFLKASDSPGNGSLVEREVPGKGLLGDAFLPGKEEEDRELAGRQPERLQPGSEDTGMGAVQERDEWPHREIGGNGHGERSCWTDREIIVVLVTVAGATCQPGEACPVSRGNPVSCTPISPSREGSGEKILPGS